MNISPEQFYRALSDLTRLRILVLLTREGELCVCELTHAVGGIQPKVSRHLALLRDHGLVISRRQGQWIYYQLNPALPAWTVRVLEETAKEVARKAPFQADQRALREMPDRPANACCA